jgi:hypothetical protein
MTRHRVLYVIDHQRPGRERWSQPETSSKLIDGYGDNAAQEIADWVGLDDCPAARDGCRVRVRVWPYLDNLEARMALDVDTEPAEGTWLHDPQAS